MELLRKENINSGHCTKNEMDTEVLGDVFIQERLLEVLL